MQIQRCSAVGTNLNKTSNPNFGFKVQTEGMEFLLEKDVKQQQIDEVVKHIESLDSTDRVVKFFSNGYVYGIKAMFDKEIPVLSELFSEQGGLIADTFAIYSKRLANNLITRLCSGTKAKYEPFEPIRISGPDGGV